MKLTMAAFLPHLQPAVGLNQRDKFFDLHLPIISHYLDVLMTHLPARLCESGEMHGCKIVVLHQTVTIVFVKHRIRRSLFMTSMF